MRWILLLLLTISLWPGLAYAQDNYPRAECMQGAYQPNWAVVQVASGRTGHTVMSTGLPIGTVGQNARLILTCAHSIQEGAPTEILGRNLRTAAQTVAVDNRYDVALLRAQVPSDHPVGNWNLTRIPGQDTYQPPPAEHDPAWGGFAPGEHQYRQMEANPLPLPGDLVSRFWTRGYIQEGMSGGPVYDARFNLLGMIVAEGREQPWVMAVNAEWLRGFVARNIPENERLALNLRLPTDWDRLNTVTHVGHHDWKPASWRSYPSAVMTNPSWSVLQE